ncbi:hypothetical protein [Micromonospora nigra]|uniref:hypothetical protein n=1 Tax=Micromonospora nigra TaxID=145857 RepID=UPI001112FE30|nr:hypothetical protein [Micromonospora nigra]
MIAIGAALAGDCRGIATKHAELSMRVVGTLSPFRWTADRLDRRRARFVVFDRILGAGMVLMGVVALTGGGYLLLSEVS